MRWGVAGYGDIVTRRALPALRELGEEPVVLWGRDAARAARTARRFGVPSSSGDPRALFETTDAVYVATPVAAHLPLLRAALTAGRHALVEKPLAGALGYGAGAPEPTAGTGSGRYGPGGHAAGGRAAGGYVPGADVPGAHTAGAHVPGTDDPGSRVAGGYGPGAYAPSPHLPGAVPGPVAGVAYYRRLAPAVERLRRELVGGGAARVEVLFRCAFAPGPGDPMGWRTDPAVSGGGVLADAGSHRIDLLLMLFGRPREVRARLGDRFPLGAERRAEVDLRWESGTRAHCLFEWSDEPPADRFAVAEGHRTLTLDPLDAGRLRITGPHGARTHTLPPPANPHLPLIADFARAAATGTAPVCPVADARSVDDVIVAAHLSDAAGGRPVPESLSGGL